MKRWLFYIEAVFAEAAARLYFRQDTRPGRALGRLCYAIKVALSMICAAAMYAHFTHATCQRATAAQRGEASTSRAISGHFIGAGLNGTASAAGAARGDDWAIFRGR